MSLRGPKVEKPDPVGTKSFTFRMAPHIKDYLERTSTAENRGMTEIILFAIEMDRHLSEFLAGEQARISAMAHRMGLSPENPRDMATVLAGLVRQGLTADAESGPAESKKRR